MKKIITLITFCLSLITFSAKSQPGDIDTVNISNFTMKASEWAYYMSYLNGTNDSADLVFVRNVRTALRALPSPTWNTNLTMPSVPGKYVVAIYDIGRRIPGGEAIQLGISALNSIAAITHPVIQYYVGSIDSRYNSEFLRHRNLGKNMLLDN